MAQDIDCRNGFSQDPVIIIGTGPVGIRMVNELHKIKPSQPVVIFGDEPWHPYNRIGLSAFLSGEIQFDELQNAIKHNNLVQHHNCRVVEINRAKQFIIDETGKHHFYCDLILATGARPHKPNIPGINLPHVFTFRDMKDVEELAARRIKSRCTVVIGGGLLGLEVARAMQKYNTNVVVVEHSVRLMNKQLNDEISQRLFREIINLGIKIYLKVSVSEVLGEIGVKGVRLSDDTVIDCDTVVVAAGIVPHKKLALDSGLTVGRGVRVNENLVTSDPNIYAIGECCEFNGEVYGLVTPGLEQASVVAHILNEENISYQGSLSVAKLKLFGLSVYSAGEAGDAAETASSLQYRHQQGENQIRILVVRHRRIVGAMGIGPWNEFERIYELIRIKRRVWPWQLTKFTKTGLI